MTHTSAYHFPRESNQSSRLERFVQPRGKTRKTCAAATDLKALGIRGPIPLSSFSCIPVATTITPGYREKERQEEGGSEREMLAVKHINWPLFAGEVKLFVVPPGVSNTLQAFSWLLWLLWEYPPGKRGVVGVGVFADCSGALLGCLFIYACQGKWRYRQHPLAFRRLSPLGIYVHASVSFSIC